MMFRLRILICCLLILFVSGITMTWADDSVCFPVGSRDIKAPASVEAKRSPVGFNHSTHFDFTCNECHHKWDRKSQITSCQTSGCHDQTTADKKALKDGEYTEESIKYYMYAYHAQCRDCHKVEKAGPTGCVECHPKN